MSLNVEAQRTDKAQLWPVRWSALLGALLGVARMASSRSGLEMPIQEPLHAGPEIDFVGW